MSRDETLDEREAQTVIARALHDAGAGCDMDWGQDGCHVARHLDAASAAFAALVASGAVEKANVCRVGHIQPHAGGGSCRSPFIAGRVSRSVVLLVGDWAPAALPVPADLVGPTNEH